MKRFVAVILLVIMVSTFSVAGALIQSPFPIDETLDIVTPVTDEILEKYGDFIEYAKKEVIYDGKEIPVNLKKVQSCLIVPNEKTKLYTSDGYDWDIEPDRPFWVVSFEDGFKQIHTAILYLINGDYANPTPFFTASGEIETGWVGELCIKACAGGYCTIYLCDNN